MSKELEALENIKHYDSRVGLHEDDYKIIEIALKEKQKQDEVLRIIKRCYQECPDNNKVFGFTHYEGSFVLDTFGIGNACFLISEKEKELLKEVLEINE